MEMARIGATEKGGSRRLALSDEDRQGRDLFTRWCESAGCSAQVDRMGNIFVRRPGKQPDLAPVATGSHLDTQPHGGKFDGVYGVLAGLEVIRTLNDHGIETDAPIEVAVWTNEEGARFSPAMVGSAVFAGSLELEYALRRADSEGKTMGAELERIGYAGALPCGDRSFGAFFEAHIEQGPILERAGDVVGVVTGVQGIRWYDVAVTGQDAHAGPTPMELRRDALLGAASMISALNRLALAHAPHGRATVGRLQVEPNSPNTIAGRVELSVDLRHPDPETLTAMDQGFRCEFATIANAAGLELGIDEVSYTAPVAFDPGCVHAVRDAAASLGYANRDIVSGAGHDACYVSRVAPTAMIFVPCANGISHNEEEDAQPGDLEAGCNVLLHAMLSRSGH